MNIDAIKRGLTDEELVFFEADRDALDMSDEAYVVMCIREARAAEFDEVCMTTH
jgi:hypothetical protein